MSRYGGMISIISFLKAKNKYLQLDLFFKPHIADNGLITIVVGRRINFHVEPMPRL